MRPGTNDQAKPRFTLTRLVITRVGRRLAPRRRRRHPGAPAAGQTSWAMSIRTDQRRSAQPRRDRQDPRPGQRDRCGRRADQAVDPRRASRSQPGGAEPAARTTSRGLHASCRGPTDRPGPELTASCYPPTRNMGFVTKDCANVAKIYCAPDGQALVCNYAAEHLGSWHPDERPARAAGVFHPSADHHEGDPGSVHR